MAKSVTEEEYENMMRELLQKVEQELDVPATMVAWERLTGGLPMWFWPIYSYDNPRIHTNPDMLQRLGINPDLNAFPLPPKSPDMHRIIERVHGRICTRFRKWLADQPQKQTIQACIAKLREIFFQTETPTVHQNDIASYHEMLQQIVERQGAWPERRYR